jgi:Bacterial protein of unknown function (Gcw_chp)
MRSAKFLGAVALTILVLQVPGAAAQATVGADVSLFSSYVWRGVSLTNRPVAQPNVYLTVPTGKATVTAGGWANVDVGTYDDPTDDISQSGGVSSFNLAEFDPWAEVNVPVGKATVTGGVVGYVFPNDPPAVATEDVNTWELYGKVGLGVPLSPKLSVYYDFDKVNGAYLEGTIAHSVPIGGMSLNLGALAGFSAGQAESTEDINNFAENGFTHLDLSAGMPIPAGVLSITPVFHFLVNGDAVTKITSPTNESDVKAWGGVTISWSRALSQAATE